MMFIDSHTHLWDRQFDADRDEVIHRMREAGIGAIQVGTELITSEAACRLAETEENFWATVGQHPTDTNNVFDAAAFEALAMHPKVVAIGECGLDYYRLARQNFAEQNLGGQDLSDKTRQEDVFRLQIRLAKKVGKPVMIHCRPSTQRVPLKGSKGEPFVYSTDAYDDVLKILAEENFVGGGAAHFFVGTPEIAKRFLDIGFFISFSGVITITPMYDAVARAVPRDKILIETDAPYAAPIPHRGTRNEPLYVIEIARRLAEIRGVAVDDVTAVTAENAKRAFHLV